MSSRTSSGLRAWMIQRISAVYLAGFLIFVFLYLLFYPLHSYIAWRDWVAHPVVNISIGLFFIALLLHAWIGMRDVVLDYVKPFVLRLLVLIGVAMTLIAMGVWVARTLVLVW